MFSLWRVEWLSPGCVWLCCCCCCEVTTLRGLICHGCYERLPSLSIRTPHFLIPIKKVIFTISFCHNCLTVNIFYRSGFDFSGQFQEQEFGSMSPQLSPGVWWCSMAAQLGLGFEVCLKTLFTKLMFRSQTTEKTNKIKVHNVHLFY